MTAIEIIDQRIEELYQLQETAHERHQRAGPRQPIGGGGQGLFGASEERRLIGLLVEELQLVRGRLIWLG